MLKIKKGISLEELKEYIKKKKYKKIGIWYYYDSSDGELITIYIGFKSGTSHNAFIEINNKTKIITNLTRNNLDLIYDLIKDDLVEKV